MKYLLLIYSDEAAMNAERAKVGQDVYTASWMKYTEDLAQAGKLQAGEALHPSAAAISVRTKAGGGTLTTDGPFVETKETLGGFYVIDAANAEEAAQWASKMPIFATGGGVEVREIFDYSTSSH